MSTGHDGPVGTFRPHHVENRFETGELDKHHARALPEEGTPLVRQASTKRHCASLSRKTASSHSRGDFQSSCIPERPVNFREGVHLLDYQSRDEPVSGEVRLNVVSARWQRLDLVLDGARCGDLVPDEDGLLAVYRELVSTRSY
jgi:hypothetical protein